jgi:hypothetical protein
VVVVAALAARGPRDLPVVVAAEEEKFPSP